MFHTCKSNLSLSFALYCTTLGKHVYSVILTRDQSRNIVEGGIGQKAIIFPYLIGRIVDN